MRWVRLKRVMVLHNLMRQCLGEFVLMPIKVRVVSILLLLERMIIMKTIHYVLMVVEMLI